LPGGAVNRRKRRIKGGMVVYVIFYGRKGAAEALDDVCPRRLKVQKQRYRRTIPFRGAERGNFATETPKCGARQKGAAAPRPERGEKALPGWEKSRARRSRIIRSKH